MPPALKMVLDALAGAALLFVLLLVFIVDRWMSPASGPIVNTLEAYVVNDGAKPRGTGKPLKLGITPTGRFFNAKNEEELWDDMGKLLKELGKGYQFEEVDLKKITESQLREYDVLFLTCSGENEGREELLRSYVEKGGILYASDWRFQTVAAAFPEMIDPVKQGEGDRQELEADIVDPALRDILGAKMKLKFDLPQWKPAAFDRQRVQTLMEGSFKKFPANAGRGSAPLMVKFTVGEGTVIFTSFHNEKQNSEKEKQLLQYLVFSLVTAGIDSTVNNTMKGEGFTPQRSNLLSTPKEAPSITKKYENTHTTKLRFALGFRNEGAIMRLNIKSPEGKEFTWEGTSTVIIEVPNAGPGMWTYTVTAKHMPYENFPFTVTVGEKK